MRINTNVSALNAQRQLSLTNASVNQAITRLSSGFRINRAADDAAGLGIANKLRGDIRSMTQAARNGDQANSLAQIAEGAVSGVQKLLERMKELATQANSATADTDARTRLQAEWNALVAEVGRTAVTTQFGSTKLINGGFGTSVSGGTALTTSGVHAVASSGASAGTYTLSVVAGVAQITANGITQTLTDAGGKQTLNFSQFGISIQTAYGYAANALHDATVIVSGDGGSFMISSSGSYGGSDLISFSSVDMRTGFHDGSGLNIDSLTLDTMLNAQTALSRIDTAIGKVSAALGSIGAFQNRVENSVANLRAAIENLSASESVIRDLDMAAEMTVFSRNQILQQAGTAMLAQANQSSQSILQLLRG
jgi:flagellin